MEYLKLVVNIFSVFLFLFLIFRKLQADHHEKDIIGASIFGLIVCGSLWFVSKDLNEPFVFILISVFLLVWWLSSYRSWKFWPTLEVITVPGLIAFALVNFNSLVVGGFLLALISNLYWRNYRHFSWYPSGKAGFIFLADLMVVSTYNIFLDLYLGKLIQLTVWAFFALISVLGIIFLSGKREARVSKR